MNVKIVGAGASLLLLLAGAAGAQTSGAMVGSEDSSGAARPNSGVTPHGPSQIMEKPPEETADKPSTSEQTKEAEKQTATPPKAEPASPTPGTTVPAEDKN